MRMVFLDTVGLLALWDAADQWHEPAQKAFDKLLADRSRLYTSSYIFLECGNAASRKRFRPAVDRLRQQMRIKGQIFDPTDQDIEAAWASYGRGEANNAGIVDMVSFAIMRRMGIVDAFTNDRHYQAAGFNTLF
ncbi:MAG TPA: PIN domain-containing protein [Humisphaera sp.]|nr:PIN domain-containing protein [Humisphaera sp.]